MFLLLGFELQRHAAGSVTLQAKSRWNSQPKSRYILTTPDRIPPNTYSKRGGCTQTLFQILTTIYKYLL